MNRVSQTIFQEMIMQKCVFFTVILLVFFMEVPQSLFSEPFSDFEGIWEIVPEKSTDIPLFNSLILDVKIQGETLVLTKQWGTNRGYKDELTVKTGGSLIEIHAPSRNFPTNVFMGIAVKTDIPRTIRAWWEEERTVLKIEEKAAVTSSQGMQKITSEHIYSYDADTDTLTYTIQRTTRKSGPPVQFTFKRKGSCKAFYMELEDEWSVHGNLPMQAFLISLQGLANIEDPGLYFIYPETWDYRFTPDVFDYLRKKRNFTFNKINGPNQALKTFKKNVRGYVVWDRDVRTSLIVAFTVAGLERSVVVTEDLVPLMEKAGLRKVEDFRKKFVGMPDYEIYQWAYDRYGDRCSKEYIVWMGGHSGEVMKPGVADWGILNKAFFTDLSTDPEDEEEYTLANEILSDMNPFSLVFGWHSYAKDKERDHVTLTSSHGLRVEGLHTLPNMSFISQVPLSPGFTFKNNHHVESGKSYMPEKKTYIACIQTDCLGLGAWNQPGRGQIPYAWEVTMNWSWLAPAMMEFFYSQATPNDYFIGALSGPGYLYPKAVPPEYLDPLIGMAWDLMNKLDLRVFEIMDYSEGATVEGNTELTEKVVDAYYKGMPEAIGFINGYAPSFTFTCRDNCPLISYDYYLSPGRSEEEAAADLEELAEINSIRPYFLLIHVREWSDITRVKSILDRLGQEFEVVPLDVFVKMAGNDFTFKEKVLKKSQGPG